MPRDAVQAKLRATYEDLLQVPDTRVAEIVAIEGQYSRVAEAIALGGIDAARVAECRELGFDGVAVLGAVWRATSPVMAFLEMQQALPAHAH